MPQVSIITPVYIDDPDKLIWLGEMIESLQAQTLTDWECILIDDSSPLPIDEIKIRFQDDARLRWLKNARNYGPAMTRNSAVALAKSEAILPVDADDMLANPQALERLYQAWQRDKSKTVFGNLQVLQSDGNTWQHGRVVQLAEYSFENAMNLGGVMPVTAMHSRDTWHDAGGWKPKLAYGREDVEYWISCGKAGHCGQKINHTTLLYRKHEQSRDYRLKFVNGKVHEMNNLIQDMHADIYKGDYPMGCCGGRGNQQAINQSNNIGSQGAPITTLDQFRDEDKVWVQYQGNRSGSWQIMGRTTRTTYTIQKSGHKLQVHLDDLQIFKSLERGQGFLVGIPAPTVQPEPQSPRPENRYRGPEPELATVERLDSPQRVTAVEATPPEQLPNGGGYTEVSELGLADNITQILALENWTVEKLAEATVDDLLPYRGIGTARASQIVEAAKKWVDQRQ